MYSFSSLQVWVPIFVLNRLPCSIHLLFICLKCVFKFAFMSAADLSPHFLCLPYFSFYLPPSWCFWKQLGSHCYVFTTWLLPPAAFSHIVFLSLLSSVKLWICLFFLSSSKVTYCSATVWPVHFDSILPGPDLLLSHWNWPFIESNHWWFNSPMQLGTETFSWPPITLPLFMLLCLFPFVPYMKSVWKSINWQILETSNCLPLLS